MLIGMQSNVPGRRYDPRCEAPRQKTTRATPDDRKPAEFLPFEQNTNIFLTAYAPCPIAPIFMISNFD
jgi:hypothetical protein